MPLTVPVVRESAVEAGAGIIATDIPARLDRLRWGRFHTRKTAFATFAQRGADHAQACRFEKGDDVAPAGMRRSAVRS